MLTVRFMGGWLDGEQIDMTERPPPEFMNPCPPPRPSLREREPSARPEPFLAERYLLDPDSPLPFYRFAGYVVT